MTGINDALRIGAGKDIPTCRHRFRPLRFVTEGDTGYLVEVCLLLYTARVGEYACSIAF